jgi:IS30 family transposase
MRPAVETHPEREKIIQDLIAGKASNRAIALKYGISHGAINRYLRKRLIQQAAAVAAERDESDGKAILSRLESVMERIQKLLDACNEYLTDPNNPDKYNLYPRAWEIDVIYRTRDGDKPVTQKESLQVLLETLETHDYKPTRVWYKSADPRKLIIDAASAFARDLELMAKIQGSIKDQVTNTYNFTQVWIDFKEVVIRATEDYPEVRDRIVKEIEYAFGT